MIAFVMEGSSGDSAKASSEREESRQTLALHAPEWMYQSCGGLGDGGEGRAEVDDVDARGVKAVNVGGREPDRSQRALPGIRCRHRTDRCPVTRRAVIPLCCPVCRAMQMPLPRRGKARLIAEAGRAAVIGIVVARWVAQET